MQVFGYAENGSIQAEIDGAVWLVPDDPENTERRVIAAWEAKGNTIPPYVPEPQPATITVVYPVDLWSRMTDEEADAVVQAMTMQPARIQNIFRSASSYRSDHELWPMLETVAVNLFGAERAARILAASQA